MTVTVENLKSNIIDEVGDSFPPVLAPRIDELWERFSDYQAVWPRLQELFTKRACIDIVRATLRNQVDFSIDGSINLHLSERVKYLSEFRAETCSEIARLERIARANRTPLIGQLVNTEIEPVPTSLPVLTPVVSQNDPTFRGDVYRPNSGNAPTP